MSSPACEDRGAELFLAARGGETPPDLARHLASCDPCRGEMERLRPFTADLPSASLGLAPRPSTREVVLRTIAGSPAALPPPPRLLRRGPYLPSWAPVVIAVAGAAALVLVMARPRPVPRVEPSSGGVSVTPVWGAASLDGVTSGGLPGGAELSATDITSVQFGEPFEAEVVFGVGARLRVPPEGGSSRALELVAGAVHFDPATAGHGAAGPGALLVRAGGVEVDARGAQFSVERRDGGAVSVVVESGTATVRAGGKEVRAAGPCRVDSPAAGPPGEPVPAETADATGWFAYPLLSLERKPSLTLGEEDLVLVLRPSVPRRIRIAPWDRFDPLFSLRVHHPERGLLEIPVKAEFLRRPAPAVESDGAFLLGPENPYTIHLDPGALGLPPGKVRLEAVYSSGRPGGLWRGTRASKPLEYEVRR